MSAEPPPQGGQMQSQSAAQAEPPSSSRSQSNDPPRANDPMGGQSKEALMPPPAHLQGPSTLTWIARIPLSERKKYLLGQLFDTAGEPLRDYLPYDHSWPTRLVKGTWYTRPRLTIPLLPPRSIIAAAKLTDIFGELDKFCRKKTGLSLQMSPHKDVKSGKVIIALVCFSILANILVTERGKPTLIQALANYVGFLQMIQRHILEEIIDLNPVMKHVTRKNFDAKSLSILAILTTFEREAKKRQAEEYAKLANQLFPPIDEIKDVLKRIKRFLFTIFIVAQHDQVPDDDLLNRLFDPNPTFIDSHKHDETAGLDEDDSQKLALVMKRDGMAFKLLVEKREEIAIKLKQLKNVHVLDWVETQTYSRFIGVNNFIAKIGRASKASPSDKPLYVVFMHSFELVTTLFLYTSVLEQVVEKFDTTVSQLANLTAHVASAPIAACTESLAELKRKLDNFAATLNSQCSEAYGLARRAVSLDFSQLSVSNDVDSFSQKQAAQLLKLENLGEVLATPHYLLKILRVKDTCDQIRYEAAKLVPHVNKLREAADVLTALENILGIISNVKDFNQAASNAVGHTLPLHLEPLEMLKRKLSARAPVVNGLKVLLGRASNLSNTYSSPDPSDLSWEVKEELAAQQNYNTNTSTGSHPASSQSTGYPVPNPPPYSYAGYGSQSLYTTPSNPTPSEGKEDFPSEGGYPQPGAFDDDAWSTSASRPQSPTSQLHHSVTLPMTTGELHSFPPPFTRANSNVSTTSTVPPALPPRPSARELAPVLANVRARTPPSRDPRDRSSPRAIVHTARSSHEVAADRRPPITPYTPLMKDHRGRDGYGSSTCGTIAAVPSTSPGAMLVVEEWGSEPNDTDERYRDRDRGRRRQGSASDVESCADDESVVSRHSEHSESGSNASDSFDRGSNSDRSEHEGDTCQDSCQYRCLVQ